MDNSEYNVLVGKRLKRALDSKEWTQEQLAEKCSQLGLELSQSSISRLLKGIDKFDAFKIATICKALELKLDEVLSFDPNLEANVRKDDAFITDATNKKFQGYMGNYKGYFYSTENNDTIHCGDFKFYPDPSTNKCLVSFTFSTGKNDVYDKPIKKTFEGTAKLSDTLGAICCELSSKDNTGDVSYIIFKYDFIANQQCVCRIGMVVTICAGLKRLPVAQKLLICRQELTETDIDFIAGQLRLNDDVILISDSDYYDFKECPLLPESFKAYVNRGEDLFALKAAKLSFYSFREDDVLESKTLSRRDKSKVINLLRKYSNSKRCKKVGPKSEAYIFNYLNDDSDNQLKIVPKDMPENQ